MSTSVTLTGRVGGDPEVRFTTDGKPVATFSLATDRRVKADDGEWESRDLTWWRVSCWERLAEAVGDTLRKGDSVIVVGRAALREYERDGQKRTSLDVHANHVGIDLRWHKGNRITRASKPEAAEPETAPF